MGYTIRKRGDQFCVYETGADEEPQGEALGCHDTREAAQRQISAIGMSSSKASALQECVSRKIRHLLNSGYERDQAIAIAYSECGEKSWEALTDDERAWWLIWAQSVKTVCPQRVQPGRALTSIKRLDGDRVGGYGVVWGDPQHTDLSGDYFTPQTSFFLPPRPLPHGVPVRVSWPWLYDHATAPLPTPVVKSGDAVDYVLGEVDTVEADDIGLWIEAQVQRHDEWAQAVLQLVDQGVLHWSSGSSAHLVKRAPDGWLQCWPIIEMSATPTPAEPRHTNIVLKHYLDGHRMREETPVEGARRQVGDTSVVSQGIERGRERPMGNTETLRAQIEAQRETIMNAAKQAEGGGNVLEEALRPLAEQLAEIAGVGVDKALATLIQFVASAIAPSEAAPAEAQSEPVPEALSVQVEQAVAKALQGMLPGSPRGGMLTGRNPNIIRERMPTLGGWIKAIAQKRWDILERYHPRIMAEYKALGVDPDTAGGYLVPTEQSNQIIEMLRADTVVLPLCRQLPMNTATVTIPTQTGGASVAWVGENESIPASQPTFGQKRLVARKLAVLVQVSNELLADSDPAVDALIREDIARAAAEEVDRVILEGTGLGGEPLGVLYAGATTTALDATPTYVALSAAIKRVEVEDVARTPVWAWVFSPREKHTLRMLEDAAGSLIFAGPGPYQQAAGGAPPATLLDYPWYTTNVIRPDANNETRMYFGQWQDVIVGMRKSLEIMASAEAGTAFQTDQTWIRAILRMDVVLRHPESIEVLTDVREPS